MTLYYEKYLFKEYDAAYLELFKSEKRRLLAALGPSVQIEHIGSTSVPGLGGKGVIDMYIIALIGSLESLSTRIRVLGYELRPHASTPSRLFHKGTFRDDQNETRMFHIHLVGPNNEDMNHDIAFRDWLRTHPEDRRQYERIKRRASEISKGDAGTYKTAKTPIMEEIRQKATATNSEP